SSAIEIGLPNRRQSNSPRTAGHARWETGRNALPRRGFAAMTSQLLKLYGGIFALVLAASLLLAFLLSSQFLRFVTNPILSLAGTARRIAHDHDYSVRATKVCGDEVGGLTDAFNQMLTQIQSQDSALQTAQHELQEQVIALQRAIGDRERAEAAQARLTAILE